MLYFFIFNKKQLFNGRFNQQHTTNIRFLNLFMLYLLTDGMGKHMTRTKEY